MLTFELLLAIIPFCVNIRAQARKAEHDFINIHAHALILILFDFNKRIQGNLKI